MTPEIRERMEKVRRRIDSPNAGEADAARIRYAEMLAKYGCAAKPPPSGDIFDKLAEHYRRLAKWAAELAAMGNPVDLVNEAIYRLFSAGYGVQDEGDDVLYITPLDDVSTILYRHLSPEQLPAIANGLEAARILAASLGQEA